MKVKLNTKQLDRIRQAIAETDRKRFDIDEVSEVFRMLQYWAKSMTNGKAKVQSVAELPDGYLCRVNSTFREEMKDFLREARRRVRDDYMQVLKEKEAQETVDKYDQLIKEAEEKKRR